MDRVEVLLNKAKMGDITTAEQDELREALKGYAPSSQQYQRINEVVPGSSDPLADVFAATENPGSQFDFDPISMNPGLPSYGGEKEMAGFSDLRIPSYNQETIANALGNLPTNPGGSGIAANPGLGYGAGPGFENPDIMSYYQDLTGGTPFAGMGPEDIEMLVNNPSALSYLLAQQEGAGPHAAAFLGPRVESAMALSGMGLLGRNTRGVSELSDLTDAPASDIDKLLAAQEFLEQFNQPGTQFVDTNALYQESFNRASNTNFEGLTDQNGQPLGLEGSISLTNDALLAAAPFMSQETQAWLSSALNAAAVEYMAKVSTGEISMSYPNYLKTLGIDQMLAGA